MKPKSDEKPLIVLDESSDTASNPTHNPNIPNTGALAATEGDDDDDDDEQLLSISIDKNLDNSFYKTNPTKEKLNNLSIEETHQNNAASGGSSRVM